MNIDTNIIDKHNFIKKGIIRFLYNELAMMLFNNGRIFKYEFLVTFKSFYLSFIDNLIKAFGSSNK